MKILKNLFGKMAREHKAYLLVVGIFLIALIGTIDYLTGPEIGFALFYLIPIFFVTWNLGFSYGILASVLSAAVWLLAEVLTGGTIHNYLFPLWNSSIRLFIFLILSYAVWLIRIAERTQRELMEFIVHDLSSPIVVISEGLNLLLKTGGDRMPPDQKKLVTSCVTSCRRARTLINSILDLSRLEAGKMALEVDMHNVKKITDLAVEEVSIWAARNKVAVKAQHDTDRETIYTDRGLLLRVLINLLGNAIKVSPPETIITVRVFAYDETNIAFSVQDRGPGIPKNMTSRMFDKFEQIKAREHGFIIGSGIGLNFCKRAVEELGGRIWIDSEENKGTTITFKLPIKGEFAE